MTIHQLKTQPIGPDKPSLDEMCAVLFMYWTTFDDIDRDFAGVVIRINLLGSKAKIESIEEARAIAWSILNRHGLAEGL